jgi:hypothetical protein
MRIRRPWGLIVRLAYAACLLGATVNHARIVAEYGLLWDYGGVPVASAAFWTSLTLLDPLTVILLVARPNAGVLATAVIIIADVVHNIWITASYANSQRFIATAVSDPFLVSQVAFLLFVIVTVPVAWKRGERSAASGHG